MENYLICPRAILAFIKEKMELGGVKASGGGPTEDDIAQSIDEEAENLKQLTIDKRVAKLSYTPIYLSHPDIFKEGGSDSIVERIKTDLVRMKGELEFISHNTLHSLYQNPKNLILRYAFTGVSRFFESAFYP